MLPNDAISKARVRAALLEPEDREYNPLVSFEFGGPALQTPTQSRLLRIWAAFYENGVVYIAPEDGLDARTSILSSPSIESLSLAFDSLMNPTLAYMESGLCKLRWYDAQAGAMVTTSWPGVTSCQITTDDKRPESLGQEDVIFAYVRDKHLYYRQQRDRYTVERLVGGPVKGVLTKVGMNRAGRLQFEVNALQQ